MLFNTYIFVLCFLPLSLLGFFAVARHSHKYAALWLAMASLFFYGWWNPKFVVLILASIAFNYGCGCAIGNASERSAAPRKLRATLLLALAISCNLALLCYFKYANFFIASVHSLTGGQWASLDIVLPIGISFYTFTQIAFLVDVHKGIAKEYDPIHYVLFVTYFPHLIAGPVLHHKQMMPQFGEASTYRVQASNLSIGLTIFTLGLAKKVLLADEFALYANPVFHVVEQGGKPGLFEAWAGALAYTLQLYFDFSGYSDMAIGLSRIFNIKLPLNFDSPYKAVNIIEFWRKWHMTLSAFLRDYLYVPLGGSRRGSLRRYLNLMATMVLGGLWHGAGWTYVLWGGLHGLFLVINHGWRRLTGASQTQACGWRALPGAALTFGAVVLAWVPFRSSGMEATLRMWVGMLGMNGSKWQADFSQGFNSAALFSSALPLSELSVLKVSVLLLIGLLMVWTLPNTQQLMANYAPAWDRVTSRSRLRWQPSLLWALLLGVLLMWSLLNFGRASEFLYFQF